MPQQYPCHSLQQPCSLESKTGKPWMHDKTQEMSIEISITMPPTLLRSLLSGTLGLGGILSPQMASPRNDTPAISSMVKQRSATCARSRLYTAARRMQSRTAGTLASPGHRLHR